MMSTVTHWMGSNTNLLEVVKSGSQVNKQLHDQFMSLLTEERPGVKNIICVFETVKEAFFSYPIIMVSAFSLPIGVNYLCRFRL